MRSISNIIAQVFFGRLGLPIGLFATIAAQCVAADFEKKIRPVLKEFCFECHSTEKHKGDLDLERFTSAADVLKQPKILQAVVDQISLDEMPPKEEPQPSEAERSQLLGWANSALEAIALSRAGDPGPVVLRRLSNAEYTYTIRDLTGVQVLDPAKEFPADSASGEGFMNVGNSLVMSPALLTKYLDAAKEVANHAVLLPEGIAFSASKSQRDWTEERLAAIRAFYARYTVNGGGTSVNLQGIRFDTKDGGILPLEKYLAVLLAERDAIVSGAKAVIEVAREHRLNPRYMSALWEGLNASKPSLILDQIRGHWHRAGPGDADQLAATIGEWQQALWRFTTVGHIGKRDGPNAWQEPITPIAETQELRVKLKAEANDIDPVIYLVASDAGDGNRNDFVVWENPRLVLPGRPDLPLRDVRSVLERLTAERRKIFASAAKSLMIATQVGGSLDPSAVESIALEHELDPVALEAWLHCLGISGGEARIDSYISQKMESLQGYDFIRGWIGADALSVIANSSDQHVRVPGNMRPNSIAVHPSPDKRVIIGWRSPILGNAHLEGKVQHAHPECGNGVTWAIEFRRGTTRQTLAAGIAHGSKEVQFGPLENLLVNPGDLLSLVVAPRDGNHSCDLTSVDMHIVAGTNSWDLAKELSPDILAGNPHSDSFGNPDVWHFYSEPDRGGGTDALLPRGSLLAQWQSTANPEEKERLARELQEVLVSGAAGLPKDSPDAQLYRQLMSVDGPLLGWTYRRSLALGPSEPTSAENSMSASWGLDPALFGKHHDGSMVGPTSVGVRAPSVIEVRLPAGLVEGCEFVVTARLQEDAGREGTVQMQVLSAKPPTTLRLTPGSLKEQRKKSTWSDGEAPVHSELPILVNDGTAARERIEAALNDFRQLFPAALCYTKIVPVDETVTLTLFYREDDHLKRLMLDEAEKAEIDRLWDELQYVSQDALKLVDAFEQLWQYATQDADPSAFEPLREPIQRRADEFKRWLVNTQPAHVEAVLEFAERAYRRPMSHAEQNELRELYGRLRAEELAHDQAIRLALARVLVSPSFLYRTQKPGPGAVPAPVSDWELATRLSYFLWSSAPDAELRAMAAAGMLGDPDVSVAQARRMLRDERVRRLAEEFACAWLHIYGFDELSEKSERHFPTFNELRGDMYEETIRFFADLFQRDGSVLEILDADYTFMNESLAAHYGITNVTFTGGDDWQRVGNVKRFSRGGILGHATTLAKQSGASRTSPILRGNWIAEVLLGDKLPRPPRDVPQLPEDEGAEALTMRQLTERHSSDPKCAGCHRRIDAFGFALEGFDAIGRHRQADMRGRSIETRARVMDGSEIEGLEGLRSYLLTTRRDAFLTQFCRKLLGYALGREVMLSDRPLLAEMRDELEAHDYRFAAAIETIVRSKQFREIRGKDMAFDE